MHNIYATSGIHQKLKLSKLMKYQLRIKHNNVGGIGVRYRSDLYDS